jgi:hypothetical protein
MPIRSSGQSILGVEGEILVSEEKKSIVELLLSIVGAKWFWMDILCVD